jgi:hypothetical protein
MVQKENKRKSSAAGQTKIKDLPPSKKQQEQVKGGVAGRTYRWAIPIR